MKNEAPISVFKYANVSDFLKDVFRYAKAKNPSYSIRAWALALDLGNPTTLFRVLQNERRIPEKITPSMCRYLKLNAYERAYFELLAVGYERITPESLELIKRTLREAAISKGD